MILAIIQIVMTAFAYVIGIGNGVFIVMLVIVSLAMIYSNWYHSKQYNKDLIDKINKSVSHYIKTGQVDEDAPDWLKSNVANHKIDLSNNKKDIRGNSDEHV